VHIHAHIILQIKGVLPVEGERPAYCRVLGVFIASISLYMYVELVEFQAPSLQ